MKLDRLAVIVKGFLQLAAANETKGCHFPETWLLNKGESLIPSLFNDCGVLSSASDKANRFAENFSKISNHTDSGIS